MTPAISQTVLVSYAPDPDADYAPWLQYHLGLGFAQIILYQRPAHLKKTTGLDAFEAAGHLVRRPLTIDVGPALKSAIVAAMTQDGLADGAFALALNTDEYLALGPQNPSIAAFLDTLPQDIAACALPLIGAQSDNRTLFNAGMFASHNGTRPLHPTANTPPVWSDAQAKIVDSDDLFWGQTPVLANDMPAAIIKLSDDASHPAVQAVKARMGPATPDIVYLDPVTHQPDWYREITDGGEASGFFEQLTYQSLVHIKRPSDQLVVTFDNLSGVNNADADRAPWAYKFLHEIGCAHLGVFAHRKDWYRDPEFINAMERLRDEGVFAGYRDVLFCGTSMGAFAALAFSSLVPGARVLAFSPQSTLDEGLVPWETRFGMGRMRNWRLPFSDAAFEIEDAAEVVVISDPYFALDQRHVDRLKSPNVRQLNAWYSGHFSPVFLRRANLLKPVMEAMLSQTLTDDHFYRLYRARRTLPWYRKSIETMLAARGHDALAARIGPAFRKARRAQRQ